MIRIRGAPWQCWLSHVVRFRTTENPNVGRKESVSMIPAPVFQIVGFTKARFHADCDFTSVARVYEEWAWIEGGR